MLLIYQPADYQPSESKQSEMFQAYMAYSERIRKAGAFVDGAALVPPTSATTVRIRDGKRLITDGPSPAGTMSISASGVRLGVDYRSPEGNRP